jgi:tryptophan synthase alpha chain
LIEAYIRQHLWVEFAGLTSIVRGMKQASFLAPEAYPKDSGRIATRFSALKDKNQCGLITFTTAGDPDIETFTKLLMGLPKAGVDLIEIGMPFSDPMADGPPIQLANQRAFKAGIKLGKIIDIVRDFRRHDDVTPVILMGYYNPIYVYGVDRFLQDIKVAGVDGLIIADLPPEEDEEVCIPALRCGLNFIRLVTPTTDSKRLQVILKNASGFLYYVAVTGITGSKAAGADMVGRSVAAIRPHTALPVAAGFGITTPEQARAIAQHADAVVVGSAIVNRIAANLDKEGKAGQALVADVLGFVECLAKAVHNR